MSAYIRVLCSISTTEEKKVTHDGQLTSIFFFFLIFVSFRNIHFSCLGNTFFLGIELGLLDLGFDLNMKEHRADNDIDGPK